MPRQAVATRDAAIKGLTFIERKFLMEVRTAKSWKQAADNIGVTHRQAMGFFKNPEFKKQYDSFFDAETIRITEREIVFSSGDIVPLLDEAKTAYKDSLVEDIECPQCGNKFSVIGKIADWVTRLKAIEMIAKATGLVQNQSTVKVSGGVSVAHFEMTTAQAMALGALNHGRPVPPGIYKELQELSAQHHFELPALPAASQAIDAEYKVLDNLEEAA